MVRTKLTRLLYFVGAGTVCTVGINKYREIERNSIIQKQQQQLVEPPLDNRSNAVWSYPHTPWTPERFIRDEKLSGEADIVVGPSSSL